MPSPSRLLLPGILFLFLQAASLAQNPAVVIPAGTPLPVKLPGNLPMKSGEPFRAELLYPVYVGDQLILPAKTALTGSVVRLDPDRTRRVHARLRVDFTPFHIPVVQFDHILLANGTSLPISTGTATEGAPIYRLVAPPPHKGGFISQQFAAFKQGVKDRVAIVTGPDKAERLTQFLYSQLPYHPERIAKDTAWTVETVETSAPFQLSEPTAASAPAAAPGIPAAPRTDTTPTWILQAYLGESISSTQSKPGEAIHATVAEPVLNPNGTVAVPVGSILSGSVTQAKPARSLGRAGTLRFSFRELQLPGEQPLAVQAALTDADSASGGNLQMNSEGEVKPKPQDKLIVPFILLSLAARPLDRDGGRHMLGKDAVASNALGLIGFIVGTAARRPTIAAGIGYYGAAISIYERIFRRGKEVAFARDTRVVIQTTPRRSAAIKPNPQP